MKLVIALACLIPAYVWSQKKAIEFTLLSYAPSVGVRRVATSAKMVPASVLPETAISDSMYSVLIGTQASLVSKPPQYERKCLSASAREASRPERVENVASGS